MNVFLICAPWSRDQYETSGCNGWIYAAERVQYHFAAAYLKRK